MASGVRTNIRVYQRCKLVIMWSEPLARKGSLTSNNLLYIRDWGYHWSYTRQATVTELPTKIHPIACQTVGQSYWTRCPLQLTNKEDHGLPPPGLVTYDNILDGGLAPRKGKAASDGSVNLREQVAVTAWVIATGTEHQIQACFLMENVNKVTSYISEFEGILRE